MNDLKVFSIGKIENEEENVKVVVEQKYAQGLKGLEGYSHVQVIWWMDACDNVSDRGTLVEVDVRNVASQRILEKCGFTREGLIRQGKMVNTWCDYYVYGILDTDRLNV